MSDILWAGMFVGVALGLAHAVYVYRVVAAGALAEGATGRIGARVRAGYYALWTVLLWTLFGTYVLVLWLISLPVYGLFRLFGWRQPDSDENNLSAESAPATGTTAAAPDATGVKTVGIIGAGVSGLATARVLTQQGIDCCLYERGAALGGVWTVGYVNCGAQVQKELYELPDWPFPEGTPNFTPLADIRKYLGDYADRFGITPHIRFNAAVSSVAETGGAGTRWRVTSEEDGETRQREFDMVVVCAGLYSNTANMPVFPGQEKFAGQIMHVSEFQSHDQVAGKRVAVLGYGKSATDAAVESAAVAAKTDLVFHRPHWPVPRKLAGLLPFKWGMFNRLTSAIIPRYQHATTLESVIHSVGKPLVWFYWRLVELLLFFQMRLGSRFGTRVSLVGEKPIEIDSFGETLMLPRPEFSRLLRRGGIGAHRTGIAEYTPSGVNLENGMSLDIDIMILGTGWKTDLGFLDADVLRRLEPGDDGIYLYRHMLHPEVPNLVFVGRASSGSSMLTYSLQARWLGELIKGHHRIPAPDAMLREIRGMKLWKRKWMPFSSARGARLILHMLHYHDELLKDIGANPLRKTGVLGPLKELIAPYEPRDYRAIAAGDWKHAEALAASAKGAPVDIQAQ